jgi:hypothetical protein
LFFEAAAFSLALAEGPAIIYCRRAGMIAMPEPPQSSLPAADARPDKGRRTLILLAVVIALGGAWAGFFMWEIYWTGRDAGSEKYYYQPSIELCRVELFLRAASVRRFAAREGRLPASLSECRDDTISFDAFATWLASGSYTGISSGSCALSSAPEIRPWILSHLNEPWHPSEYGRLKERIPDPSKAARPEADQDLFGLPIVYLQSAGARPVSDVVLSSDPFPLEIQCYLVAHGGVPPPCRDDFALASLFIEDRLQHIKPKQLRADITLYVGLFGGVAFIILTVLLALRVFKTPGRRRRWLIPATLVGGMAAFTGFASTKVVMCYAPSSFSTSGCRRQDRLHLLDEAVQHGRVTAETAARARKYIEQLPE